MAISAVIVDSREPAWVRALSFGNAPTTTAPLGVGDLHVATDDGYLLAIERKTGWDLLHSIHDDRLWSQLEGLRALTPWAYLVVMGDCARDPSGALILDGRSTDWTWASLWGALLTVQELGVHVLFTGPGPDDYEATILRLGRRSRRALRVTPAREARIVSDAEAVLTALPSIGPEKAQALLAYCGTAAHALSLLTDDTWQAPGAPGIGPGTIARVRKALGLPEWALLEVTAKPTADELTPTQSPEHEHDQTDEEQIA